MAEHGPDEEITLTDVLGPPTPRVPRGQGRDRVPEPPDAIVTDPEEVERSPVTGWPQDVHLAFQKLWIKSVGQLGYDKREWRTLRQLLDRWLLPPGD